MNIPSKLLAAAALGNKALNSGGKRDPVSDRALVKLIKLDESDSIPLKVSWLDAWDAANLSNRKKLLLDSCAKGLWDSFNANAKRGVRLGLFPAGPMMKAKKMGYDGKDLAAEIARLAREDDRGHPPKIDA